MTTIRTLVEEVPFLQSFYLVPKGKMGLTAYAKMSRKEKELRPIYKDLDDVFRDELEGFAVKIEKPDRFYAIWKPSRMKSRCLANSTFNGALYDRLLSLGLTLHCAKTLSAAELEAVQAASGDGRIFYFDTGNGRYYPADQWIFEGIGRDLIINLNAVKRWFDVSNAIQKALA
jgi:hypothetical protein